MNSFSINLIALQNVLVCGLKSSASQPAAVQAVSPSTATEAGATPVPPVVAAPPARPQNPPSVAPPSANANQQREQEDVKINALWNHMQPIQRKRALVLLQTEQREETAKRQKLALAMKDPDCQSSLTTQTFEKTYRLNDFQDYLKLKPRGTGWDVDLGNIGKDTKFGMNVFPNGNKKTDETECPDDEKNERLGVSFFHTGPETLNWKVSASIHSEHGFLTNLNISMREQKSEVSWGFLSLCKHAHLQNVQTLYFQITVTTVQEQHEARIQPVDHAEASTKELISDLQELWNDDDETADVDIKFTCNDGSEDTLSVHSWILSARSPVLKAQIKSWLKPDARKEISMTGLSLVVVTNFIYYLYTADLADDWRGDLSEDDFKSLLHMSEQYLVPSLKKYIGGQLLDKVNRENCLSYLTLASTYDCKELKDVCLAKACASMQSLMGTEEWRHLDADILREIMTKHFS